MNTGLRLGLIILTLGIVSCKNEFSINAPSKDVYALSCIIRSDQSIQYAIITRNIMTENGTAPSSSNMLNQNIKGIPINIFNNDSTFVMRDTTIQGTDVGSETPVNCYYVKNLILTPGKVIRIEAKVPDGTLLTSSILVPQISFANPHLNFPMLLQWGYYTIPYYFWSWRGNADVLNLPQLEVYYQHQENGIWVDKKIFIPLALSYLVDDKGHMNPVNVDFTFNTSCTTMLETVNKSMQDISGSDPNKNNYSITKAIFSVLGMDPILTRYYLASHTYAQEFTIKLRQTEISNIEGGIGIFGEYYKYSQHLMIDSLYVQSFGYLYHPL